MQGAEHVALHLWLENLLEDFKDLKKGDDEYSEVYADLKWDIAEFCQAF